MIFRFKYGIIETEYFMGKKKGAPKSGDATENIAEELKEEQIDSVEDTTSEISEAAVESAEKTETLNQSKADKNVDFKAAFNEEKEKEVERLTQRIEDKNRIDTKKKRRNWWIKTTLMLILIGISIGLMFTITTYLSDDGAASLMTMIAGASWQWFLIFIGVILFSMFLDSMKYGYLMKISTGKFRFRTAMKTNFLGKYYDGITPLGTGGQPFQIYYLHKKDIPAGVATAIPLVKYIVMTVEFCLISLAMAIYVAITHQLANWQNDWGEPVVLAITFISIVANLLIPIAMLLISFFPRGGKKLVLKVVQLLHKMHIVKRPYAVMKKYIFEAEEYKRSMKLLFTKWWKLIPLLLICVLNTLLSAAIPFFALMAIAGPGITNNHWELLIQVMCLSTISYFSASLVPTPGNSGANEAMASLVFLTLASVIHPLLSWIVLLWRFGTYYIYIISGIGLNVFDIIRSAVRQRRARKHEHK